MCPVKMTPVKDAIQDIRHGVRGVDGAVDFEERQDAATGRLLGGKKLNIEMVCATAGTAMGGHGNGAFIVFASRCGSREGETQIRKYLTDIFDDLARIAASDDFGLRRRRSGGALDPSFGENHCSTEHDDDAGDRTWVTKDKESGVGSIHVADGLYERVVGGKERIRTRFRAHRRECTTRQIPTFFASEAPVYETAFAGTTEVAHDRLSCLKMHRIRTIIVLAENADSRANVKTANLHSEDKHASEAAMLKTKMFNNKSEGSWV
jgi:hypothetical protein